MTDPQPIKARRYVTFPPPEPVPGRLRARLHQLANALAAPVGLAGGWMRGAPGLAERGDCFALAARALRKGHFKEAAGLVIFPMDSFRYFELDFVRAASARLAPARYLDVSSPRLVPLMLLDRWPGLTADLINPIPGDLRDSMRQAEALGLARRARPHAVMIEEADFAEAGFDLVTSISVVEHIPGDRAAIARMWRLVKPGGKLILTVPCAREAAEEYTNVDEYGLFAGEDEQFVYWQRYYDRAALQARIWDITGPPERVAVYGEKAPGCYDRNVVRKRSFANYPFWREPLMMARDYRYFEALEDLPGMGVIGMVFTKRAGRA